MVGEQAFYNAILPPDQENPHTFATLGDDFVPLALIWWQAQEQPPAEYPLPPRILTLAHVRLVRDIHAAQTEENISVMRTQQQRGVSALPNEDIAGGWQSATVETQLRYRQGQNN